MVVKLGGEGGGEGLVKGGGQLGSVPHVSRCGEALDERLPTSSGIRTDLDLATDVHLVPSDVELVPPNESVIVLSEGVKGELMGEVYGTRKDPL